MDAHKGLAAAGGGGGGGGGEVRRINVVYFLSRGGRTDHPHLFRVNHLNRAGGVRLRDVKRWLSELRGKDMPDNYSWSYKRKYKAGYVWQDLKDDDLITPVSDNEYVLKGCDVRGTPPPCVQAPSRTSSLDEKKRKEEEEAATTPCNDNDDQNRRSVEVEVEVVLTPGSDESSPKPPPPADQEDYSPGGGCCESARRRSGTAPFKVDKPEAGLLAEDQQKQQEQQVVIKIEVSRSQSQNHQQQQKHGDAEEDEEAAGRTEKQAAGTKAVAEEEDHQPRRRSQSAHAHDAVGKPQARTMRVARALHDMLTCARDDDADDAALRPLQAARRQAGGGGGDDWPPTTTPMCPGMESCGLGVSRKTTRTRRGGGMDKQQQQQQQQQRKRDGEKKKHDGAHNKPATLPRCSQCGKEFKPQELHSHMQSCRGFKERMMSSTSADRRRNWTAAGHYTSNRPSSASAVFLLTES